MYPCSANCSECASPRFLWLTWLSAQLFPSGFFLSFRTFIGKDLDPPKKNTSRCTTFNSTHSRVFNDWNFSIISIPVRPLKAWFPTWIFWGGVCLFGPKGTAQPYRNSFISVMNIFWLLGPAFPVQLQEYMGLLKGNPPISTSVKATYIIWNLMIALHTSVNTKKIQSWIWSLIWWTQTDTKKNLELPNVGWCFFLYQTWWQIFGPKIAGFFRWQHLQLQMPNVEMTERQRPLHPQRLETWDVSWLVVFHVLQKS